MTPPDTAQLLRDRGLRVTRQRLAVLAALAEAPHSGADAVLARIHAGAPDGLAVSTQAVYDVLHTLTDRGLLRRIQPAGSVARYELRVGDNHHHVVCRGCGAVSDIDCATGSAPCLEPGGLDTAAPGFVVDRAEVTYWGVCAACAPTTASATTYDAATHRTDTGTRPGGSA
jgi:Fur family ferric uptake transcriptional regulator